MTAGKTRLGPLRTALWAAILTGVSWAAPPVPPSQPNKLAVWPQGAGSPAFRLVDTEGLPRTLSDYRGHVGVIYFGLLHCPDACPAELVTPALIRNHLGHTAAHAQ